MVGDCVLLWWPGDHPRWCGCVEAALADSQWDSLELHGYEPHMVPIEDETG